MSDPKSNEAKARAERQARRPEITRWKKVLLACAGLFVIVGGALRAFGGAPKPATPGEGAGALTSQGAGGSSLVGKDGTLQIPGFPGPTQEEPQTGTEAVASEWSPFFLKGGFSFFVAFCVGYAMRVWLKMSFLLIGTFFLGVFVLSYLGVLSVDWNTLQGWYDKVAAKVGDEASDFRTFLTGSLPQAGLASLGLVTGFKRR